MTSSVCRCSCIRPARRSDVRLLLHARRPARRAARRLDARLPSLHPEPRAAVSGDGDLELRPRVRLGPDSPALRALQQRSEVLDAARARARDSAPTRWRPATTRASSDPTSGRWLLKRSVDRDKDQSYFLFSLTQEQLAGAVFPVGSLSKPAVRAEARRLGLAVADKADSQEICFVPDGDYAAFVARRAPDATQRRDRRRAGRDARLARGRAPIHHRPAQGSRHRDRSAAVRPED